MNAIDLRSDTVTKPGKAMLQAMMSAPVGDDVYGEDPTVNELQEYCAKLFGMEAALFCSSGTMTNQIAIKMHTQPGDELICADNAHVYKYEGGGIAFNSGVQAKTIPGNRGRINVKQIEEAINGDDPHFPITKLVCLENTHNRGGGSIYEYEEMDAIARLCKQRGLLFHLDGARIFNAFVEKTYTPSDTGRLFDSISICLSKGLGAPVGSVLVGSKEMIARARRIRKVFGGGMRQAGFLAAAGLYALRNNVDRMKVDHARAKEIGSQLNKTAHVLGMMPVESNLIIFQLDSESSADNLRTFLNSRGILCSKVSADSIRFVFHLDIDDSGMEQLSSALKAFGT